MKQNWTIKNKKDDINSFEKYIINNYSQNDIELILEYLNSGYCLKVYKSDSMYAHKYTCAIDFEFYYNDNKELENKVNELIEKLVDDLQVNVYYSICDEMEEIGYSCYDVDQQDVEEYIECFEYEFLEDGSIYE